MKTKIFGVFTVILALALTACPPDDPTTKPTPEPEGNIVLDSAQLLVGGTLTPNLQNVVDGFGTPTVVIKNSDGNTSTTTYDVTFADIGKHITVTATYNNGVVTYSTKDALPNGIPTPTLSVVLSNNGAQVTPESTINVGDTLSMAATPANVVNQSATSYSWTADNVATGGNSGTLPVTVDHANKAITGTASYTVAGQAVTSAPQTTPTVVAPRQTEFSIPGYDTVKIVDGRTGATDQLDPAIIAKFVDLLQHDGISTDTDCNTVISRGLRIILQDGVEYTNYQAINGRDVGVNLDFVLQNDITTTQNRARFRTAMTAMLELPYTPVVGRVMPGRDTLRMAAVPMSAGEITASILASVGGADVPTKIGKYNAKYRPGNA